MDIAANYFNSYRSTKLYWKGFKLAANPSVCNRLKIRHANTSDGTFWKDEYEIEKTSFIILPAVAITLSGPLDKHGTYMSSAMKK